MGDPGGILGGSWRIVGGLWEDPERILRGLWEDPGGF